MTPVARHILLPAIAPALFFAVALTPVHVLGCRTRGLLAFAISLASGLAAIGTVGFGLRLQLRRDPTAVRWLLSTLILTVPVVALLVLA